MQTCTTVARAPGVAFVPLATTCQLVKAVSRQRAMSGAPHTGVSMYGSRGAFSGLNPQIIPDVRRVVPNKCVSLCTRRFLGCFLRLFCVGFFNRERASAQPNPVTLYTITPTLTQATAPTRERLRREFWKIGDKWAEHLKIRNTYFALHLARLAG